MLLEREPVDRSPGAVHGAASAATMVERWLGWAVPATPQERAAALWSFAYFFMLLAGYYILRPLRDRMGIAGGVKALPWMFTATFDGKPGFVLLADQFSLEGGGHAEDLEDHDCAIAHSTP